MDKGANINHHAGEYESALQAHCHGSACQVESLRFLLQHRADINEKGGNHGAALIASCAHPWGEECARLLLDHGADVNVQSEECGTALIAACQPRPRFFIPSTKTLQRLLKCGADVNLQGGKHGTALSAACSWDYPEAVELLINHGANIHLQDYAAWYSVTRRIASQGGKSTGFEKSPMSGTVMLELLLNRGMDINHEHAEYGTALHAIMTVEQAGENWCEGIDTLLKHHINPNIMNDQLGSALHIACAIAHEEVHADFNGECADCKSINGSSNKAAYLLERCFNINVNAQGGTFGTALQAAVYAGQILSVRLLLDRKADVNTRGGKYHSTLNGAIISGHWNIAKILLEAGATPDCHLQEETDEAWLQTVLEEDGRGAVERYRKFWEVELEKKRGGEGASNS
ncbi:hypothetical protein THAR02_02517 [Trichoderma harzianum]|uniref:Uncharacterized protein n=1 Tax=Trichoderma harzianum TaxID=5544 RepID=A0A0F9ZZK5_TRIHA|nr:hypothetical protein THAR02_02517 [Trichoderma harzianum]